MVDNTQPIVIAISKGHFPTTWGGDTGAVGVGGVKEFDLNTAFGDSLINAFRRRGYPIFDMPRVRITRRIKSLQAYFGAFVQAANVKPLVVVLSCHHNAGGGTGTEVFVSSEESKSRRLGDIVQRAIVKTVQLEPRGQPRRPKWRDRGLKFTHYYILSGTPYRKAGFTEEELNYHIYAALIEFGFVDSADDLKIVADREEQFLIGEAIANEVDKWLRDEFPACFGGPPWPSPVYA
ncbi:MAG: N-acetylmuramoyl-L-alanine amidase [bacterium]